MTTIWSITDKEQIYHYILTFDTTSGQCSVGDIGISDKSEEIPDPLLNAARLLRERHVERATLTLQEAGYQVVSLDIWNDPSLGTSAHWMETYVGAF